jgi:hypothetical protein
VNNENEKVTIIREETPANVSAPKKRPAIIELTDADLDSVTGGKAEIPGRCPPAN